MAKDITYGLDYYKFMDLIDSRVESVKSSLNYQIFKDDIEVLKSANTGVGLSEITANNWLKQQSIVTWHSIRPTDSKLSGDEYRRVWKKLNGE